MSVEADLAVLAVVIGLCSACGRDPLDTLFSVPREDNRPPSFESVGQDAASQRPAQDGGGPGSSAADAGGADREGTCDSLCRRLERCGMGDHAACVGRCARVEPAAATMCGAEWRAWTSCTATIPPPPCTRSDPPLCPTEYSRLTACLNLLPPPIQTGPNQGPAPPNQVPPPSPPDIPQADAGTRDVMVGGPIIGVVVMTCSSLTPPPAVVCGGISSSSAGPGACESSCRGPDGRLWSSFCRDTECICSFEGRSYCRCQRSSAQACSSCCPGLP